MKPNATDHPAAQDLARLRRLATRMDSAFRLPVIGARVGWDGILGLIPGIGDTLALVPSLVILRESHRLGVPAHVLGRMGVNTGIDLAIGAIPLVGDIFDIGWKSKTRNVDLLEAHLRDEVAAAKSTIEVEGALSSHHPTLR